MRKHCFKDSFKAGAVQIFGQTVLKLILSAYNSQILRLWHINVGNNVYSLLSFNENYSQVLQLSLLKKPSCNVYLNSKTHLYQGNTFVTKRVVY